MERVYTLVVTNRATAVLAAMDTMTLAKQQRRYA